MVTVLKSKLLQVNKKNALQIFSDFVSLLSGYPSYIETFHV
jgi:hypothetical protein